MNGMKAALVVLTGIGLAACQRAPENKAADASAQTLEQRHRREASGLVSAYLSWQLERGLRSLPLVERH